MDLFYAIKERRSIRAYKPDTVSREKIEEILRLAANAPSAINLQPWEITIVLGEERERLSRRLIKSYREKQISCSPGNVKLTLPAEPLRRVIESGTVTELWCATAA